LGHRRQRSLCDGLLKGARPGVAEALAADGAKVSFAGAGRKPCGPLKPASARAAAKSTPWLQTSLIRRAGLARAEASVVTGARHPRRHAGGPPPGRALDVTDDQISVAVNANLTTSVRLVRGRASIDCNRRLGRICCITSWSIKQPMRELSLSNLARTGLWAGPRQPPTTCSLPVSRSTWPARARTPPTECCSWRSGAAMATRPIRPTGCLPVLCARGLHLSAAVMVDGRRQPGSACS